MFMARRDVAQGEARDQPPDVAPLLHGLRERNLVRKNRTRLLRADNDVGVHHGVEEVVGDGQTHDVERLVAADQHHAAHERRAHVVGMRHAAQQRLALHGELHEPLDGERTSQQLVHPVDRGGRRGRARPDAAPRGDLAEHRNLDPDGASIGLEHGPHGRGNNIVVELRGKGYSAQIMDFKAREALFDADLQHVAHAVERQAHHIESATQIGHRSGSKNFYSFHGKFLFLRLTQPFFRETPGPGTRTRGRGRTDG